MILTDAGPIIALVDKKQKKHVACLHILPTLVSPMLVPWPCFTEAMYMVYSAGVWPMQRLLWHYVSRGQIQLYSPSEPEIIRTEALMERYRDIPMDLADAVLVAAAETLSLSRIFTLDKHFFAYRMQDGHAFEVIPSPGF